MNYALNSIKKQTVAATELVSNLAAIASDDDSLISDMVEGETSLFEALDLALGQIALDKALISGMKTHTDKVATRKERIEKRVRVLSSAVQSAMRTAHLTSHEGPTSTVSVKAIPKSLVIVDESAIPSRFFVPQAPKLDKRALTEAAKNGHIDGVEMSNGGETIQIRVG